MNDKTYLVKKFCDMVGVSYSTLRHFERIGLLDPVKNQENNYREYRPEDAYRVNNFKYYRSLGYDTKLALQLVKEPEMEYVRQNLLERENHLIDEMIIMRSRLNSIRLQMEDLAHISASEKYWIGHREDLLFLAVSERFDFEIAEYKRMSKWVELLPVTRYAKYVEYGAVPSGENMAHYGMTISVKNSLLLDESERECAFLLPGGECLYFYSSEITHPITEIAVMKEAEDYLEEHQYEAYGNICFFGTKMLDQNGKKGQIVSIPIRKK